LIKGSARGNQNPGKEALSISQLKKEYPQIEKILEELGVPLQNGDKSSIQYLCEEAGVQTEDLFAILHGELSHTALPIPEIQSLTILPGTDKKGKIEFKEPLTLCRGEIIAVVGPTGSGKSLFLSDIEGLVQQDSPSGRRILLNLEEVDDNLRFFQTNKPIAQISQTMNYLLDMSVEEFLNIHNQSRGSRMKGSIKRVIQQACSLCGEAFLADTSMTNLSGGQARALMIADAIYISQAPVILVDEIENAGIHREKAITLLLQESNITIIATHDPLIALLAHKRVVLKNGGIHKIIQQSQQEKESLQFLRDHEKQLNLLREKLRSGERLG
jgi:ABC-type lipoprotein export system ATPase subunit